MWSVTYRALTPATWSCWQPRSLRCPVRHLCSPLPARPPVASLLSSVDGRPSDRLLRAARCFELAGHTQHAASCLKRAGEYQLAVVAVCRWRVAVVQILRHQSLQKLRHSSLQQQQTLATLRKSIPRGAQRGAHPLAQLARMKRLLWLCGPHKAIPTINGRVVVRVVVGYLK